MILRGRHRRRQMAEAEFFQARQETFLLLAAKHPEHEFGGVGRAAPRHHRQNEAGEIGVIEIGDAAPSQPLRFLRVAVPGPSVISLPTPLLLLASQGSRSPIHVNFMASAANIGRCPALYGHMQGAIMRKNILLAIVNRSAGASARRLQRACHRRCRTDVRSFSHPAGAGAFLDPDGQYRHRHRLAVPAASRPPPTAWRSMRSRTGLDHPRTLYVLPNGDVLVAETNAPPKPDDGKGIKALDHETGRWAAPAPVRRARTASRCCATPMATASPETRSVFLEGLNSPFGMALVGEDFYVANSDAIVKFPYHEGDTKISRARRQARRTCPRAPSTITGPRISTASPDGIKTVRNRRLQQQCRRERHRGRDQSRRRARSRSRDRQMARVRVGPAQSERAVMAAAKRRAVDQRMAVE